MTLKSEDMGKLVAGRSAIWLGQWLRDIMRAFRPAHREAQPDTDGGGEVEALLSELVDACQPLAEKARRWDEAHGAERRDSVQIDHRIGDFRRIRDILDRKSCAQGGPK